MRRESFIRFAVNRGMDVVNRDTTAEDNIVSSGPILRSFVCWKNMTALDTEWLDDFTSGSRMLAVCLVCFWCVWFVSVCMVCGFLAICKNVQWWHQKVISCGEFCRRVFVRLLMT